MPSNICAGSTLSDVCHHQISSTVMAALLPAHAFIMAAMSVLMHALILKHALDPPHAVHAAAAFTAGQKVLAKVQF